MLQLKTNNFFAILEILKEDYSNDLALCLTKYITVNYLYYDNEAHDNSFFTIILNFKEYYLKYKKELEEELENDRGSEHWVSIFDHYKSCVNALIEIDEEAFYSNRFHCFEKIYIEK